MKGILRTNGITPFLPSYERSNQSSLIPRHILNREAGRALEILGHAIDYLADELIEEGGSILEDTGRVEAIQLLMARNRQIYFSCPVALTFGERLHEIGFHFFAPHRQERRGVIRVERDKA